MTPESKTGEIRDLEQVVAAICTSSRTLSFYVTVSLKIHHCSNHRAIPSASRKILESCSVESQYGSKIDLCYRKLLAIGFQGLDQNRAICNFNSARLDWNLEHWFLTLLELRVSLSNRFPHITKIFITIYL